MSASGSDPTPSPIDPSQTAVAADYRLLALLGQGQFAQVYCAVHRRTGRLVAIKETRHLRQRGSQEPLVLQGLDHPNIVRCQAAFKTRVGYRLVLDYCEAGTLRSHLNSLQNASGTLPLGDTQTLIGDLLKGLSYLHQRGIAHGDLKPENLFLTYPRTQSNKDTKHNSAPKRHRLSLKLGDFGNAVFLSRFNSSEPSSTLAVTPLPEQSPERSHAIQRAAIREIGSPTYAAPERFENPPSIASDLYSVGVMLYELLLGDRPFSGPAAALQQAHQNSAVPLPGTLTQQTKQLLTKALHKQPEQRFSSAEDMHLALLQLSAVTNEADDETSNLLAIATDVPEVSLSQCTVAVPSNGITPPIESLVHVPQGCCIITAKSLHLLTPKRKLLSIARFQQPCWIAVAPNGKWFAAVSKKEESSDAKKDTQNKSTQNRNISAATTRYRFSQGMIGRLSNQSGHQWRRAITLKGRLLTELRANVLQVIALNNRYLLRVSTTERKTFFECFTRRGQFVGELSLNLRLTQVTRTAVPYQLAAIAATPYSSDPQTSNTTAPGRVVLISLKPFQIRTIPFPMAIEHISALPWGYLVSYQRSALLLDRSAQVASLLTGLPSASKISAISNRNLLITNGTLSSTTSSHTQHSPIAYKSSEPLSLIVADTSKLDLGLIF